MNNMALETRYLVVANQQAVISPFWRMSGANITVTDMKHVIMEGLKS
jgi:5-keto 4-deoxyuronate isomerase